MPNRTILVLGLTLLMGAGALAQPYPGDRYDDRGPPPPPPPYQDGRAPSYQDDREGPPPPDRYSLDLYCRHEAAARTGYVTPDQAARRAQTNGSVGGLLGGAALGAILGGRNAGAGAAIGAGAGLLAGSAVGASNADRAAASVERHYDDAYYDCMDANRAPPPGYAPGPNDRPPPPPPPPRGQYNDQDNDEPPPPPPRDRY